MCDLLLALENAFGWGVALGGVSLLYVTFTQLPPEIGGTVRTKSGTYEITTPLPTATFQFMAPAPILDTEKEKLEICKGWIESFEKAPSTLFSILVYRHYIKRYCRINPDDIINNLHRRTTTTN